MTKNYNKLTDTEKMSIFAAMMRHNTAKWLGSLLFLVVLAAGCGVLSQNATERRAEEARVAALTQQRLDARQYRIAIEYMYPTRGASRYVGGDSYSLTIDGDKINSHLPYTGVAYQVPYGGGKVLNFEDTIEEYVEEAAASDRRVFVISTDNDEDFLVYQLTVYDNGKADLLVRAKNREQISYRGHLDPDAFPGK